MLRYHLEREVQFAVDTIREYNFKYFICWDKSDFIPFPTSNQMKNIME